MKSTANGTTTKRFASGLIGAAALTGLNEGVRRVRGDAPRLDRLGMRALAALIGKTLGWKMSERTLYGASLVGDLASNTAYYSTLLQRSSGAWSRMALGGLTAGLGALIVPQAIGGGHARGSKLATQVMTVAWYTAGALAAAGVYHLLTQKSATGPVHRMGSKRRL